jgi:hypothetical protein
MRNCVERLRVRRPPRGDGTWPPPSMRFFLRTTAANCNSNDVTGRRHPTGASAATLSGPPKPGGGPAGDCAQDPSSGAAGVGEGAASGCPGVLETPVCGRRPLAARGGEGPGGGESTRGVPHAAATEPRGAHPNPVSTAALPLRHQDPSLGNRNFRPPESAEETSFFFPRSYG